MEAANNLGKVLVERKLHLVYGGGSLRLMGCVAIATHVGGSQDLGIIPTVLTVGNIIGKTIGEELQVSNMQERILKMLNNFDAFTALLGGYCTMEEIFQITSWAQLNIHHKPIGLLNVNDFFNGLISFLDHVVEQKFISHSARRILVFASTTDQLIDKLQAFAYEPDPVTTQIKWLMESSKKYRLDLTLRL